MTELWISPFILWLVFAVTIPAMAITRYKGFACWMSGFICAVAVMTTIIVATARF